MSRPKRVMLAYGTRPEAIKMAPVVQELHRTGDLEPIVVLTGQHRSMLDQVNLDFGIVADHDLALMRPGQTLVEITVGALQGVARLIAVEKPDALLIQGDTTSALSAALAAFYAHVPTVHLEAGLRTSDMFSPYPEEVNRRMVTRLASLHLAPTPQSRDNLLREDVDPGSVVVTGNTVIDALLRTIEQHRSFSNPMLVALERHNGPVLLVTTHRRESWGDPMREVGRALAELARRLPALQIVLPVHLNPVVRDVLLPELVGLANVAVLEPLPYADFARLLALSTVVLTDSGGVQEEAPSLGKPVLVLRDSTERPEAIAAGTARLVGTSAEVIVAAVQRLVTDDSAYAAMARAVNPYGDGRAASRTAAALNFFLGQGPPPEPFTPAYEGGRTSTE